MSTQNIGTPHIETNEDGKDLQHPGYTVTGCKVCGRGNIHTPDRSVPECIGAHKEKKDASSG